MTVRSQTRAPDRVTLAAGIGRWIEERCLTGPSFYARSGELLADYAAWARQDGQREIPSSVKFAEHLKRRGLRKRTTRIGVLWDDIALQGEEGGEPDENGRL